MQPSPDTEYYARLGLECDPFAAGAMPDFFFVGAQRRFLVQRAVHALYFSGATVLLLGAAGVGKTRTLTEIEKELQGLADICRVDATVLMDAGEIRGLLAAAFNLPAAVAAGNAELIRALEHLRPANGDPQPVLLAIDAAHLLSIESLAECSTLVAAAGGRVRLLLSGEADLAASWHQAQAGAAETLELVSLDRRETADYVSTRLQAAGYRGEQPLTEAEFDLLFAQSGGNFAAIDTFAPQLLAGPSAPSPVMRRIRTLPPLHIGLITVLLAVVILLLVYRGGGHSRSSTDLALPSSASGSAQSGKPATGDVAQNSADQSTVALKLPAAASQPESPAGQSAHPSSAQASAPQTVAAPPPKHPSHKRVENEQKSVESGQIARSKKSEHKVSRKATETHARVHALDADEKALLALPSTHFVLQLMGAELKKTVDKFAAGGGRGLKLYCYRTRLRGRPWYVVVTGPYRDKAAALRALAHLPAAARRGKPWPRKLANVQADIRAQPRRR